LSATSTAASLEGISGPQSRVGVGLAWIQVWLNCAGIVGVDRVALRPRLRPEASLCSERAWGHWSGPGGLGRSGL